MLSLFLINYLLFLLKSYELQLCVFTVVNFYCIIGMVTKWIFLLYLLLGWAMNGKHLFLELINCEKYLYLWKVSTIRYVRIYIVIWDAMWSIL